MEMTKEQLNWLTWLRDRGGRGFLDRWGRMVASGETSPQGACTAWLNLIGKGYVCADDGVFTITTKGRSVLS